MEQVAAHLRDILGLAMPILEHIPAEAAEQRPAPGKWSKKEIIGHLIDSAGNNQQKFVRTMQQETVNFPGYQQDDWVNLQQYQQEEWKDLLKMFEAANRHIAHIIDHIPESCLSHTIVIGESSPFTLAFIVSDYPEHLKHHLKAILPKADFLENKFRMVY